MRASAIGGAAIVTALVAGWCIATPAGAGPIEPDASFTVTVSNTSNGGLGHFNIVCRSDLVEGTFSLVSINDPTFPLGEGIDAVSSGLGDGERTTVEVYVRFAAGTTVTCGTDQMINYHPAPARSSATCMATGLVACIEPTEDAPYPTGATLAWADIDQFPATPAGSVTIAYTHEFRDSSTTTSSTPTSAVPPASRRAEEAAVPRFTG